MDLSEELRKISKIIRKAVTRNGYYTKDLSKVKRHIEMTDTEKAIDLVENWDQSEAWKAFIQSRNGYMTAMINRDNELWQKILDVGFVPEEDLDNIFVEFESSYFSIENMIEEFPNIATEFLKWFKKDYMTHFGGEELPTWFYMDEEDVETVKNQWLVHFTQNAQAIAEQGFTKGIDPYAFDNLGLTTAIPDSYKLGGYNFAYTLDQVGPDLDYWSHFYKWGQCVVFRASGIQVFHRTDDENQVIFMGNTATDIVPIFRVGGDWCVGSKARPVFKNSDFKRVTQWVANNYVQYQRTLRKSRV